MLDSSVQFTKITDIIAAKIAELLCAPVFVINHNGAIVTSSEPDRTNPPDSQPIHSYKTASVLEKSLRIPLHHSAEIGEVIVGESYNQEAIPSRLAQALVEMVVKQTINQTPLNQHELKDQLINNLLHGQIDSAEILGRAKQFGMDLTQPRAVILIDASAYILQTNRYPQPNSHLPTNEHLQTSSYQSEQIQQRVQMVINSIVSFFHLPNDTICANLGEGIVCVLKASNTRNLDPWAASTDVPEGLGSSWANLTALKRAADALLSRLRCDTKTSINIGIGRYHPGLQGLSRSYEDAWAALSLGKRFHGSDQVHCLGELGIASFVGVPDEETKIDLAKYLLSPLDQEPELLLTLNAFFSENCCPSSTAKRLSIHRNTLSYRLDKIATLTGLEPRKFDDAVQMRLSLLLRSLQPNQSD